MKVSNLLNKLNKLNINHSIIDVNGYNQDVEFSINNMTFKAGYLIGGDVVEDFCREICFDKSTQETQRRFFDNFNQVLKYANN